jgi:hypothetical protein
MTFPRRIEDRMSTREAKPAFSGFPGDPLEVVVQSFDTARRTRRSSRRATLLETVG